MSAARFRIIRFSVLLSQVKGMARQKVRPALQLLSATTASAIERYIPGKQREARFIRLFDSFGDILNAGFLGDTKPLRRGYSGSENQEYVLSATLAELQAMRSNTHGLSYLFPFQKGMIVTIRSVRGLLADMKNSHGEATYILTRRLSQDRLESFFGLVRTRGGNSQNPSPTEARSRVRLLTLQLAMRRGVNPLEESGSTPGVGPTYEEIESRETFEIETEVNATLDSDVAADIETFCRETADADDQGVEGLLEEFINSQQTLVRGAMPPSTTCDQHTGVPVSDSALAHMAGYVARKRPNDPAVGNRSGSSNDGPIETLWTRLLSHGGLTVPTEDFLRKYRAMDAAFSCHHALEPDGLSRRPGVVAEFRTVLDNKFPDVAPTIRKTFSFARTMLRLSHLNAGRREASVLRSAKKIHHHRQ